VPLDVSKRWFAWTLRRIAHYYDGLLADRKRSLLGQVAGTVVEIGPGTGANLHYYPSGIRWIGVEPNWYMHPHLRRVAESVGIDTDIVTGRVEALGLIDQCADAVVATAVLCSVDDLTRALREIRRILKPGGRFFFIEHVAAERGTLLSATQRILQPFWSCVADGCHPARDTSRAIIEAGFRPVILDDFRLPMGPCAPHIAGVAVPKS
jgi:ubiquinone/menaquinone biosynthesis C-methylase UbiE